MDREATQALLQSKQTDVYEKGILMNILTGAVWTQERALRASMSEQSICTVCELGEVEDHMHL